VNARELEVQLEVADLASAGTARIDVRAAGVGSNEMAFVVSAGVASVEVLGPADLWSSDVSQYVAVARDAERRELPGRTVQWSSANTNVLMVDTHGLVFAPGSGATTLTARVGTVAGSTRVTVVGRPAHDVIYHSMRSGRPMLIRQPMDADEPAQAVMAEQRYAVQAAVSPDGQKIAFVSLNGTTGDIYVVNRDGTGLRRLTDHAASDEHPAWSPDGARIAFRSERSGAGDIWVMNADGSDQRQVTGLEYQFGDPSSFHPVWSLDGQRILFAQGSSTVSPFRSVIMSIRPDGTDLRAVTNRAGYSDEAPALSPDGRFLAIARRQVGAAERHITLLSPDGTELVLITYPGRGTDPAWSPDGQWLAYTDADGDIALTRPNEEIVRKITARNTGGGESATWIPR
jgi:Tol biopolymer transport system component